MAKSPELDAQALAKLAGSRGVATFGYDNIFMLVEAPVDVVAAALVKIRPGSKHLAQVTQTGIVLTAQSYLVARLRGHKWTMIYDQAFMKPGSLNQDDAQEISGLLGCRAMYYGNSDTACALSYWIFDRGALLEMMITDEGYEFLEFDSPGRNTELEPSQDVMEYVNTLFKELDAFEPGFGFRHIAGYIITKPGDKINVGPLDQFMDRVDHVTLDADALAALPAPDHRNKPTKKSQIESELEEYLEE